MFEQERSQPFLNMLCDLAAALIDPPAQMRRRSACCLV
jgi:hypothetical protein